VAGLSGPWAAFSTVACSIMAYLARGICVLIRA
jgi:hypothetical protein